jgi:hypothetical protein
MALAGTGEVSLQWTRQPAAATRKGKTQPAVRSAPTVELVAPGEPSDSRWKQKGTQIIIPLRNGWHTKITVDGHVIHCVITVAEGSKDAVFSMSTGNPNTNPNTNPTLSPICC